MLNDPVMRYELIKAAQRDLWREAERARQVRAARVVRVASLNPHGWVRPEETTPDPTGLVERIIQRVWKRLGLPVRETDLQADGGQSGLA